MLKQFPFELDTRLIYYVPYLVVRFTEKNNKKTQQKTENNIQRGNGSSLIFFVENTRLCGMDGWRV
jgi:hypothetical protein